MTDREAITRELKDARERRDEALCEGQPELAQILDAHIRHLLDHLARPDINYLMLRTTIRAYRDALSACSTGVLLNRPLTELADLAKMVIEDTHAGQEVDLDMGPFLRMEITSRARDWTLAQRPSLHGWHAPLQDKIDSAIAGARIQ